MSVRAVLGLVVVVVVDDGAALPKARIAATRRFSGGVGGSKKGRGEGMGVRGRGDGLGDKGGGGAKGRCGWGRDSGRGAGKKGEDGREDVAEEAVGVELEVVLGRVERSVSVPDKILSLSPPGRVRERQRQENMQPRRLSVVSEGCVKGQAEVSEFLPIVNSSRDLVAVKAPGEAGVL